MTAKRRELSRRRKRPGHRKASRGRETAQKAGCEGKVTAVDQMLRENRRLLFRAADDGVPVAMAVLSLIDSRQVGSSPNHSDERYIALVFGSSAGSDGRTPLQCDRCHLLSLERRHEHACEDAKGQPLSKKVRTPMLGGHYVCLLCFYSRSGRLEMVGHMLTHSWAELRQIGISDQLVRRYISEQRPPQPKEEMRQAEIQARLVSFWKQPGSCYPLGALLRLNADWKSGLTGQLMDTLSGVCLRLGKNLAARQIQLCRVSEPSCWVMRVRSKGWYPCFTGQQYYEQAPGDGVFPPSALVTDVTFKDGLSGEQYLHHDIAAALALLTSGSWTRHAVAHGAHSGKLLETVGWAEVKHEFAVQGQHGFAAIFEDFFRGDLGRGSLNGFLETLAKWAPSYGATMRVPGPGEGKVVTTKNR